MAVYIFPVDAAKVQAKTLDAGIAEVAVKALDLTIVKDVKPTYRESAKKIYEDEVEKGSSMIIVDPSLSFEADDIAFEADDIAEDFSFGNGTTMGAVRLKSGEWVQCGWVVFDHADKSEVDAKLTALKSIFKPS